MLLSELAGRSQSSPSSRGLSCVASVFVEELSTGTGCSAETPTLSGGDGDTERGMGDTFKYD